MSNYVYIRLILLPIDLSVFFSNDPYYKETISQMYFYYYIEKFLA
jgi:hypothetical protein